MPFRRRVKPADGADTDGQRKRDTSERPTVEPADDAEGQKHRYRGKRPAGEPGEDTEGQKHRYRG